MRTHIGIIMIVLGLAGCNLPGSVEPTATPLPPTQTAPPASATPSPTATKEPASTATDTPPTVTPTIEIPPTPDFSNVSIYGGAHIGTTRFNVTLVSVPPGPPERFLVHVNFTEYECVNLDGQSPWWLYCRGKTPPVGATVKVSVYLRPGTEANPGSERILLWEGETTIPAY